MITFYINSKLCVFIVLFIKFSNTELTSREIHLLIKNFLKRLGFNADVLLV